MSQVEHLEVLPDIARICEGLRDTGYDLNMAVADIVDNSISAGASRVEIRANLGEDGDMAFSIADNGHGMNREGLINAMRYGSESAAPGLSKFGLGLKTASTAFCRKLALCSRPAKNAPALTTVWDLDLMEQSQSWLLQIYPAGELEEILLASCAGQNSGTVVIWDRVDRMRSRFIGKNGEEAQEIFHRIMGGLRQHLSTVFQRYLDENDHRAPNLSMQVNGVPLEAWDPFCLQELGGSEEIFRLQVTVDEVQAPITVEAFILPREEEFSSSARFKEAQLGPEKQGIYVYRENRLIHGPNWLEILPQEPQYNLLRISLSFDHPLDEVFMVDIKKSRILINEQIYGWLKNTFLPRHRATAEERYRKGAAKKARLNGTELHAPAENRINLCAPALPLPRILEIGENCLTLENYCGTSILDAPTLHLHDRPEARIVLVEHLEGEQMWEPVLINDQPGIAINTSHPFYQKIYLTHQDDGPIIQALDSLLWILGQTQWNYVHNNSPDLNLRRQEISHMLKELIQNLPDAD